jgi:hypothetical protein
MVNLIENRSPEQEKKFAEFARIVARARLLAMPQAAFEAVARSAYASLDRDRAAKNQPMTIFVWDRLYKELEEMGGPWPPKRVMVGIIGPHVVQHFLWALEPAEAAEVAAAAQALADADDAAKSAEIEAKALAEARARAKAEAKEREKAEAAAREKAMAGPVLVRRWPPQKRGIPSALVRCPLFPGVPRARDKKVGGGPLPALGGSVRVGRSAKSTEWSQPDLSVALELIQGSDETGFFEFGVDAMLMDLGITPGRDARAALFATMERLQGAVQTSAKDSQAKAISSWTFVREFKWLTRKNRGAPACKCSGFLAKPLITMFLTDNVAHIDIVQRRALPVGLAQWFHAFYSSHRQPFPFRLSDLARWSGHDGVEPKSFNRSARKALDALVAVGFLVSYSISSQGVLSVVRAGAGDAESQVEEGDSTAT